MTNSIKNLIIESYSTLANQSSLIMSPKFLLFYSIYKYIYLMIFFTVIMVQIQTTLITKTESFSSSKATHVLHYKSIRNGQIPLNFFFSIDCL